jgi:hypothetical protein
VVKRDKVVDERGRSWLRGRIGADEYFAEVVRSAREQARRSVEARISQPLRRQTS